MRFLKTYLITMIIIFILILFAYTMSFVYVQSVETTQGTTISVLELDKTNQKTVFYVYGNKITVDAKEIEEKVKVASKYLPTEVLVFCDAVKQTSNFFTEMYNRIACG